MSQPNSHSVRAIVRLSLYSAAVVIVAAIGVGQPVGQAETRIPATPQPYQQTPSPTLYAVSTTAAEWSQAASTVGQRLTDWFDDLNLAIRGIAERPDRPDGEIAYVVKDVFTTLDGSWIVDGQSYAIPMWAKAAYENLTFSMELQKSKHLYAAVLDANGTLIKGQPVVFWSSGFTSLPAPDTFNSRWTQDSTGWATWTLFSPSSDYDPVIGAAGPWCWAPVGAAEVMCGGGLPNGASVSIFVVWQQIPRDRIVGPPTAPAPTAPTPTAPTPTATPPAVTRRLGTWVLDLGLQIKSLADRPDGPSGEVLYLIKDVFTTRDGSWEPSNVYGAVDSWARTSYLKPLGDPEYFDDAGADHHLFAAILDLEGRLLKSFPVTYWSDGFGLLGDPTYAGYATQYTKDKSGWGNLVMGPSSSYVPERGEHGPWCWMPQGLPAEVMCGGGMPAKQHISVFVVWQAVPDSAGGGEEVEHFDHLFFLPFVVRDS